MPDVIPGLDAPLLRALMPLLKAQMGGGQRRAPGAQPAAGATPDDAERIAGIESGGRYDAVGPATKGHRPYGKYQVMDFNIGPWTEEVLGRRMTPEEFVKSEDAQERVFAAKFGQYKQQFGAEGAARAWFGGPGHAAGGGSDTDVLGTSVDEYGRKFAGRSGGSGRVAGGSDSDVLKGEAGEDTLSPPPPLPIGQAGQPGSEAPLNAVRNSSILQRVLSGDRLGLPSFPYVGTGGGQPETPPAAAPASGAPDNRGRSGASAQVEPPWGPGSLVMPEPRQQLPPFEIPGLNTLPPGGGPQPLPPFEIPGLEQSRNLPAPAPQEAPQAGNQPSLPAPAAAPRTPPAGAALAAPEGAPHAGLQAPTPQYRDPLMALGNPLTAIALIGSMFTRTPATAALKTAAAAMKAQAAGDQTAYINQYTAYQGQLKQLHEEVARENSEYKRIWESKKLALQEKIARMRMEATRRGDKAMNAFLDSGGDPGTLLDHRGKAIVPISDAMAKRQRIAEIRRDHAKDNDGHGISYVDAEAMYKVEKDKALAKERGQGTTDKPYGGLTGQALLDALPPDMADYVKAISEGREKMPTGKWAEKYHMLVNQYSKGYDAKAFGTAAATLRAFAVGREAKNVAGWDMMLGHLNALADSMDDLNNSNWRTANRALNAFAKETGDPRVSRFLADVTAVAGEAANVFKGQPTEGEIKRWESAINLSDSPKSVHAFTNELVKLLQSRIAGAEQQRARGLEGTTTQTTPLLSPHGQEAIDKLARGTPGAADSDKAKALEDIWK